MTFHPKILSRRQRQLLTRLGPALTARRFYLGLYGLAYFDDADRERMPRMLDETNWRIVKESLRRLLRGVSR